MSAIIPPSLQALQSQPPKETAERLRLDKASEQFEAILLQQLVTIMRKTAASENDESSSGGGGQYLEMFDSVFAQALSESGGVGLKETFSEAIQPSATNASKTTSHRFTKHTQQNVRPQALNIVPRGIAQASGVSPRPIGSFTGGATGRLQIAAAQLLSDNAGDQWSKNGRLDSQDLSSSFQTATHQGAAKFNVQDANGYEGQYKCNLFALELARRAGYTVPVVGRERGWGYPTADAVTHDAATDGQLRGGWARVVSQEPVSSLNQGIQQGRRAFMLTGSADGERHGHMAVVERIHDIQYNQARGIERIVFDGWEARGGSGADHLVRRTWNRYGNPGGTLARNGFDGIEILELQSSALHGGQREIPLSKPRRASLEDAQGTFPSRLGAADPKKGLEDENEG